MKNKYLLMYALSILMFQMINGQKLEQDEVEKLTQVLNTTVATKFKVELKKDKAYCNINQFSKTLDLRDNYYIAEDSLTKHAKTKLYTNRYVDPIFWKYDFKIATNSEVLFKATKRQQIFCKILFKEQDTISLKSQLNTYSSNHKTSDSSLHTVEWSGNKYISFLLTPKRVDKKLVMEVRGITISGKFQRKDNKEIAKNYTKSLQNILKREFKKLFESEEMTQFLSLKTKN